MESDYYAPAMTKSSSFGLPLHVQARASVARRARYAGLLPIAKLPRLAEALAEPDGDLAVELQAGQDAGGAPFLKGTVAGEVGLVCQRCLRPFRQQLDITIDLRLVESEADEERLMQECEPYQVVDDRLPLHDIIEDEALLALPLAPRCGQPDCTPAGGQGA